jgi:hypothetical protein
MELLRECSRSGTGNTASIRFPAANRNALRIGIEQMLASRVGQAVRPLRSLMKIVTRCRYVASQRVRLDRERLQATNVEIIAVAIQIAISVAIPLGSWHLVAMLSITLSTSK